MEVLGGNMTGLTAPPHPILYKYNDLNVPVARPCHGNITLTLIDAVQGTNNEMTYFTTDAQIT